MPNGSSLRRVPFPPRAAFNIAFALEHCFPRSGAIRAPKDAARHRVAQALRAEGAGRALPVDRARAISPRGFRARYLRAHMPVVIEGAAAQWACCREWSFEAFDRRYGSETITVIDRPGLTDDDEFTFNHDVTERVAFSQLLAEVGRRYLRFSPLLEKFPEPFHDLGHGFFFRSMAGLILWIFFGFFIGGTGSSTPLHNAMTPFLFVNVCGVKCGSLALSFLPAFTAHDPPLPKAVLRSLFVDKTEDSDRWAYLPRMFFRRGGRR